MVLMDSTDVLSTHKDSTTIAWETNPPSNSNEEGVAEGLVKNQERVPPLMKAIDELQSLTNALQAFHQRWDELQKLVDFIENAIESKEKQLVGPLPSDPPKDSVVNMVTNESKSVSLTVKDTNTSNPPVLEILESKEKNSVKKQLVDPLPSDLPKDSVVNMVTNENESCSLTVKDTTSNPLQNQESLQKNPVREEKPPTKTRKTSESELESICCSMSSRELRRYITNHFPQHLKLRQEVPLALHRAPNPAELVLNSVGKFYSQSRKSFFKNPTVSSVRRAAPLVLEYFLLMEHKNRIDKSVMEESKRAVLAWKKRLNREGGLLTADMQDARGLLLLVGCFGIPDILSNEDLMHLFLNSNPRDISEALRKSSFLVARVPAVIQSMSYKGMTAEALDIAYTFGLEDKLSQKILAPFLKSLNDTCKEAEGEAKGSPTVLKEAIEKQLMTLKSLMKFFDAHKVDLTKVMPGLNLDEKIIELGTVMKELDKKVVLKRKTEDRISSVLTTQNSKRPKVGNEPLAPVPSSFSSLQEPRGGNQQLIQPSLPKPSPFSSLQEQRVSNQQPVPPPLANPSPFSSLVDPRATNQQGYDIGSRYSDPLHGYGTIGVSSLASLVGPSYGASMPSGSSFHERLGDHSFVGSMGVRSRSLMEPSLASEVFRVPPTFGGASQSSSSDLYGFADVIDNDYARSSYNSR